MASGSAEDRWRRGRRCQADPDDEPEEGAVVDFGCHSETDTEEYYNRHSPSEADETISDCGTSPVAPPNDGSASPSSVPRGRGVTGKRVGSGVRAVSPSAEPEQSMATVAAEPKVVVLQPVPLAFATPNLSAVPNLSGQSSSAHDDAMEIVAAAAANPPTEAVVHQQPIAPPPPAARAGRQDPNGYTCKKCGMWFRNHQGLGGHMVGHKNRELAAFAEGMLPAGRRNPKPEKTHVCGECGAEFLLGVQLGGHKRRHWKGPPIVPKKKPRVVVQPLPPPAEAVADLTLALAVKADEAPPPAEAAADLTLALAVKVDEAPPAPPAVEAARPAVERTPETAPRRRVLLFGFDINKPGVQNPEAQQGSAATETSSSTGGEQ